MRTFLQYAVSVPALYALALCSLWTQIVLALGDPAPLPSGETLAKSELPFWAVIATVSIIVPLASTYLFKTHRKTEAWASISAVLIALLFPALCVVFRFWNFVNALYS
jgi:hypothetical protein